MTTGLKVWLWLALVWNAIVCVASVFVALAVPLAWISFLLVLLMMAGVSMLLFARKKAGFYLICGAVVLELVGSVVIGGNLITSMIRAAVMPLITWLLMKNTWYEFQ